MTKSGSYNGPAKKASPFRMGQTPFDPRTGRYLSLGFDESEVKEFTVVSAATEGDNADDCLVCEDPKGVTRYVAKPYMLQRTPFDGETIDGVSYVYSTASARTADGDAQEVTPPYVFDGTEKILVARIKQGSMRVGPRKVEWVDLNTCGRDWGGAQPGGGGNDVFAKVSSNDTDTDYLSEKITTTGPNLTSAIVNPSGDETFNIEHDEPDNTGASSHASNFDAMCFPVAETDDNGHIIGYWGMSAGYYTVWWSPWGYPKPT